VETDKATVEIESQVEGVLVSKIFEIGEEIPEDGPIAMVGNLDEIGVADAADEVPIIAVAPSGIVSPTAPDPGLGATEPTRLAVSPRARKRATEFSVTLDELKGSGPGGRIIERDVLAASVEKPAVDSSKDFLVTHETTAADQVIAVRGARRLVAERMHASLRDTAQLTMTSYADATRLLQLRNAFKAADPQFEMSDVTLNDLLLFAVARTLAEYPEINAICRDADNGLEILRSAAVHLAFAVDTSRVLMVPVIRDAADLRVHELSTRASGLAKRCRDGSVAPAELSGGTFTVSNLGSFGIESFTPILNPPQAAILGIGAVTWRVVGEQEFQQQVALSLTIDHRLVDGAPAARFLQTLCARIAELDVLLAL
jgi:pyruvate dehydrogenase E2 component (dihydrolipoamide acetyltransferase)